MKMTEQGVLQQSKLARWLIHILLPLTFFLAHPVSSETSIDDTPAHETDTPKNHVLIVYSPDSSLHSNVVENLSDRLKLKHPDITVSKITAEEITAKKTMDTSGEDHDLIIIIGHTGMRSAETNYPKTKKLFISTDPNKYQLDPAKNKNDAVLYMTQSYCRQLHFIKLLNDQWKTISILNSKEKPIDSATIRQCADESDIKAYIVGTSVTENLTSKLKHALQHSDVLLALPDSSIYNSKTVKNILLTSYRYRKPVIAFSRNFTNAGALASIHSSKEQIAHSASIIIDQYFNKGNHFSTSIHHPELFDVSINRQVSRALNLSLPNAEDIKQALKNEHPESAGKVR
ncbi:MAG: hypothetical protein KAT12_00245 [Gammaproteobacteria bacterium]|nr:hypothetical protein [Gammaproteobacteria bacterium]